MPKDHSRLEKEIDIIRKKMQIGQHLKLKGEDKNGKQY